MIQAIVIISANVKLAGDTTSNCMFPSMEQFSKLKEFGIICHPRKSTQIKQSGKRFFRNHHAVILGCFAFHIGIKYVLFAELLAANKAIEICRDKGWQKMWIECDSMLVVQAFKNEHIVPLGD
ncbi:hypothetical protein HKD37_06G017030 [Glycine soja]